MSQAALPSSFLPFAALLASEDGELLQLDKPLWLTRAPGRLDVLGTGSEAPGTASISVPLARSVYTAIQNREDRKVRIRVLLPKSWGGSRLWEGKIEDLYTKKGPPRSMAVLRQTFSNPKDLWMMRVIAVMIGLRRTRQLNTPKVGFDIVIWSRVPEGIGFGERAAFGVSLGLALKGSTGLAKKRVDGVLVAKAVQIGFKEVLDEDIPLTDALTSAVGRADCVLYIEHGADLTMQWIPIPQQCSLAAVDLGYGDLNTPSERAQPAIAAQMALAHLNDAMKAAGNQEYGSWGQISSADFEGGMRDHAPPSQKGRDWIKAFGRRADFKALVPLVDPAKAYRLRASAEHECRESDRARQLVSNLNEYGRTMREAYLAESGRCLNGGQRSLMEKCKITHPVADDFVKRFKDAGRKSGMFGARITLNGGSSVLAAAVHQSARGDLRDLTVEFCSGRDDCGDGLVVVGSDDGGVLLSWWEGVVHPRDEAEADSPEPATAAKA